MLTSHELFGFMSPALANDIITFTFENEKPTYRATLNAVAESRHVRGVFLERQPKAAAPRHDGRVAREAEFGNGRRQPHPHLAAEEIQGHAG